MYWLSDAFLLLLGFAVGILAGLIGVGGAIITIPALLYIYPLLFPAASRFDMAETTSITAMQSLAAAFSSARVHWKRKNIDLGLVFAVGLWSMLGGYAGGATTQWYSDLVLKLLFLILLGSVTFTLGRKHLFLPKSANSIEIEREMEAPVPEAGLAEQTEIPTSFSSASPLDKTKRRLIPFVSILIGYTAGILGVGGAVFLMPVFSQWLRLPVRLAIGTTTGTIALTCIASLLGKMNGGDFPWLGAILLSVGATVGATLGAKMSFDVSERKLMMVFLSIVGLAFLRVVLELLLGV